MSKESRMTRLQLFQRVAYVGTAAAVTIIDSKAQEANAATVRIMSPIRRLTNRKITIAKESQDGGCAPGQFLFCTPSATDNQLTPQTEPTGKNLPVQNGKSVNQNSQLSQDNITGLQDLEVAVAVVGTAIIGAFIMTRLIKVVSFFNRVVNGSPGGSVVGNDPEGEQNQTSDTFYNRYGQNDIEFNPDFNTELHEGDGHDDYTNPKGIPFKPYHPSDDKDLRSDSNG